MNVTEQVDAVRALGADPREEARLAARRSPRSSSCRCSASSRSRSARSARSSSARRSTTSRRTFFMRSSLEVVHLGDFFSGLAKTPFFGFIIAIVGCHFGLAHDRRHRGRRPLDDAHRGRRLDRHPHRGLLADEDLRRVPGRHDDDATTPGASPSLSSLARRSSSRARVRRARAAGCARRQRRRGHRRASRARLPTSDLALSGGARWLRASRSRSRARRSRTASRVPDPDPAGGAMAPPIELWSATAAVARWPADDASDEASLLGFALRALRRRKARAFALGGGLALTVDARRGGALPDRVAARRGRARARRASRRRRAAPRRRAPHHDLRRTTRRSSRTSTRCARDAARLGLPLLAVAPGQRDHRRPSNGRAAAHRRRTACSAEGRDIAPGAHEMIAGAALARFLGLASATSSVCPSSSRCAALRLVGTFRSVARSLHGRRPPLRRGRRARPARPRRGARRPISRSTLANPEEARVVARTVIERLPGARVVEAITLARVYHLAYGRRAGLRARRVDPGASSRSSCSRGIARAASAPTSGKEIAILKAVGWSTRDVLFAKMFESLLVAGARDRAGLVAGLRVGLLARRARAARRARRLERALSADGADARGRSRAAPRHLARR